MIAGLFLAALAKGLKKASGGESPGAIFMGLNEINQICLIVHADKSESYQEMSPRLASLNARVHHHGGEVLKWPKPNKTICPHLPERC